MEQVTYQIYSGPSIWYKPYNVTDRISVSIFNMKKDWRHKKMVKLFKNIMHLLLQHTIVSFFATIMVQRKWFQNWIQFFNSAAIQTICFVLLWLSWLKMCLRKKSETELDGIRRWIWVSDWLRREREREKSCLWHLTLSHSFEIFTSWQTKYRRRSWMWLYQLFCIQRNGTVDFDYIGIQVPSMKLF